MFWINNRSQVSKATLIIKITGNLEMFGWKAMVQMMVETLDETETAKVSFP